MTMQPVHVVGIETRSRPRTVERTRRHPRSPIEPPEPWRVHQIPLTALVKDHLRPIIHRHHKLPRPPAAEPMEVLIDVTAGSRQCWCPQISVLGVPRSVVRPKAVSGKRFRNLAGARQLGGLHHLNRHHFHGPAKPHTDGRIIWIRLCAKRTGVDLAHSVSTAERTEGQRHLPRRARMHVLRGPRRRTGAHRKSTHLRGVDSLHATRIGAGPQAVKILLQPDRRSPLSAHDADSLTVGVGNR